MSDSEDWEAACDKKEEPKPAAQKEESEEEDWEKAIEDAGEKKTTNKFDDEDAYDSDEERKK